jgi:hypothetical protein
MTNGTERLNAETARAKAAEVRESARQATRPEQKTMLNHIADTWERIAKSLESGR